MKAKTKRAQAGKTSLDNDLEQLFVSGLLDWNTRCNDRQMPWKGEKDPYKIWLSEIILQQTRVEQGLKYYENFIATFPKIQTLATAPAADVLKLWEGLGYYSRCRNLIETARHIFNDLHGIFPNRYEDILKLKGIGNYTAAAIASFAYNQPYAVLDGNVFRVLSRIFEVTIAIDSTEGKKQFAVLAQKILPHQKAGEYNQAIMDFGAVICKPAPECGICFFNQHCRSYLNGKQDLLPVKEKKLKVRERWLNYFVLQYKDQILIHHRKDKDIWQQLFEFLLIETDSAYDSKKLSALFRKQYAIEKNISQASFDTRQKLTHQQINFRFYKIELSKKANIPGCFWARRTELGKYAFPRTLKQYVVDQLI
jgi:A/G-specific adenine glycosylase